MAQITTPGAVAMAALALASKTIEQLVKQGRISEIDKLEIIQETAVRVVTGLVPLPSDRYRDVHPDSRHAVS